MAAGDRILHRREGIEEPPFVDARYMTHEFATARGISSSFASIAPVSKNMTLSGALMFFATMAASIDITVFV
jgi:hypothetical protein